MMIERMESWCELPGYELVGDSGDFPHSVNEDELVICLYSCDNDSCDVCG